MTTPEHLRDLADRNDAEAEAWRQFSKTSGRIALHEESATALRTAADEVDRLRDRAADDARDRERLRVDFNARAAEASRLRAVIENAPHAYGNSGYWCTADLEDAPCTCWKADAL